MNTFFKLMYMILFYVLKKSFMNNYKITAVEIVGVNDNTLH